MAIGLVSVCLPCDIEVLLGIGDEALLGIEDEVPPGTGDGVLLGIEDEVPFGTGDGALMGIEEDVITGAEIQDASSENPTSVKLEEPPVRPTASLIKNITLLLAVILTASQTKVLSMPIGACRTKAWPRETTT